MLKALFPLFLCILLSCNTKTAESYLDEATKLSGLKKYEEAIVKLDKAIELNPVFIEAYINRGADKAALGKTEAAIKDYQKVLTIDPDNMLALSNIANNYQKMENYGQAIHYLDKAIRIQESKQPLQLKLTDQQTAADDFDVPYHEICFQLGIAYYHSDSLNKANQYFSGALQNGYMPDKCYYWIGWVNLTNGRRSSACDYFTKAIVYGNMEADSVRQLYCK